MQGSFAAMKILRKNQISKEWYQKALDELNEPFNRKARVPTATAKSILLNYPTITIDGEKFIVLSKSLGAGVHELYLKEIK